MAVDSANTPITSEDIRRLCGELSDQEVVSILALEPSMAQLEAAAAWVAAGSDIAGDERPRLEGTAGAVAAILMAGQDFLEEDQA